MAKKKVAKKIARKKVSKKKVTKKPAKKASKNPVKKIASTKKTAKPAKSGKVTKAATVVESLLKSGDPAPAFKVQTETGEWVSLEAFLGKTVVLYFYPKDDTPGCTQESCDFRDSFGKLSAKGVVVLGASKDSVGSHQKFKTKYQLPFTLLSDEAGTLCESYGVWKEKSMYGRKYMGIERSTFVIDSEGRIAKVYPKVSVTGHVEQVLSDLKELGAI
ncbi:MAG: thioredoxin-dependent thiol peroxidase [Bdellovibrionales bacterium]|nr:thioredoxin-dependent thiol peroxidase [Bdellovibrionales bacterium]